VIILIFNIIFKIIHLRQGREERGGGGAGAGSRSACTGAQLQEERDKKEKYEAPFY
jgi:hypothetical protein